MVKVNERLLANNSLSLTQWVEQAIGIAAIQVRVRLKGNKLHILCEGRTSPPRQTAKAKLVQALRATDINDLIADESQSVIEQIFLYGRNFGQKRPDWTEVINFYELGQDFADYTDTATIQKAGLTNRIEEMSDKTLSPLEGNQEETMPGRMAEILEPESVIDRARQGNLDAITRYLGENLKSLGVRVKVVSKTLRRKHHHQNNLNDRDLHYGLANQTLKERRLWVFCESAYSPDPSLLASPIAQQLRDLQVKGFRDAVIISQVSGEETPDWMLRIDLTPPEQMLREWAKWGDVQAIVRLLNQAISPYTEVSAVLKETTLHISCMSINSSDRDRKSNDTEAPDKQVVLEAIVPLLNSLAPRNIQAAVIYGHEAESAPPAWVEWLNLPATKQVELAASTLTLASQGDEAALVFLLGRLLNPDMDWRLATGGIRVQVRRKEDLLHIMADAPVCPAQRAVTEPIAKFVRQLEIPDISGVRIYGRRAGQTQPLWSYGLDFTSRNKQGEETSPEFAASEDYAEVQTDDLSLEEAQLDDVTIDTRVTDVLTEHIDDFHTDPQPWEKAWSGMMQTLASTLVRSQIFTPSEKSQNLLSLPGKASFQGVKVALVWGTAGIMLTWGLDLVLGQIVRPNLNQTKEALVLEPDSVTKESENVSERDTSPTANNQGEDFNLPQVSLRQRTNQNNQEFNESKFTKPGDGEVNLNNIDPSANFPKLVPSYGSFNNRQLNEKLVIYQNQVAAKGAPDVLIVGSSRALRGVDPQALENSLASQGYGNLEIFNFGINGATAQVVDLLLRRCLTPEQLPKMIIWADGARAFNSGRADITYNAIATSTGYKKLVAGAIPRNDLARQPNNNLEPFTATPIAPGAATNAQSIDEWLSNSFANLSSTYKERDRLQAMLRDRFANSFDFSQPKTLAKTPSPTEKQLNNWSGFVPITLRFNPTNYYQKHPKVSGTYDNDYNNFQMVGPQIGSLESVLQFTQANQIPVVFVNLPLTTEYLDPVRTKHEQEFEMYMLRLSLGQHFIFRNWSKLWPNRNDYFSDPSHLNRYGAIAVSNRLAQDPLIPWPKK
ncbi:MAG TPA: hypothetical protein V6D28_00635 [Leptolyngbyaceae cyanobacterium]